MANIVREGFIRKVIYFRLQVSQRLEKGVHQIEIESGWKLFTKGFERKFDVRYRDNIVEN